MVQFWTLWLLFCCEVDERNVRNSWSVHWDGKQMLFLILFFFFPVQKEKAHGQNGGIQASWEGVLWRGPPVETNAAVWRASGLQHWPSPISLNRSGRQTHKIYPLILLMLMCKFLLGGRQIEWWRLIQVPGWYEKAFLSAEETQTNNWYKVSTQLMVLRENCCGLSLISYFFLFPNSSVEVGHLSSSREPPLLFDPWPPPGEALPRQQGPPHQGDPGVPRQRCLRAKYHIQVRKQTSGQ